MVPEYMKKMKIIIITFGSDSTKTEETVSHILAVSHEGRHLRLREAVKRPEAEDNVDIMIAIGA